MKVIYDFFVIGCLFLVYVCYMVFYYFFYVCFEDIEKYCGEYMMGWDVFCEL